MRQRNIKTWLLIVILWLMMFPVFGYAEGYKYGIVSAMPIEAQPVVKLIKHKHKKIIHHVTYITGSIDHQAVVFVISGMGRVAAAAITALLEQNFNPTCLIFVGVAGSLQPNVKIGDVVVSKAIYNAEHYIFPNGPQQYYLSANTFATNPALIKAKPNLLHVAQKIQTSFPVYFGTIVSSDKFPSPKALLQQLTKKHYLAIESEGVALAEVATFFHKPWLVIRGISNQASYLDNNKKNQIANDLTLIDTKRAANNAAIVLNQFIER